MSTERKGTEFLVGLFLLIGFAVVAVMVVIFGRVDQAFATYYEIKVEFPNASGLIKGADVILAGANVGKVGDSPKLIAEKYSVVVPLKIRTQVKIPRKSYFQIRSNGMLGDSYVDVIPPAKFDPADIAKDGEEIEGTRIAGFDDLTKKGTDLVDRLNSEILKKLSDELDELRVATKSVNERLLTEKNLQNIEVTFENLRGTSKGFVDLSKQLDEVVSKTGDAVVSAKGTLKTVDSAVTEMKGAVADFRKMADSGTKTVDAARVILNKVNNGEGTLGLLVTDRQTAENFRALIANLRRSGMLFYKDRAVEPAPEPQKRKSR